VTCDTIEEIKIMNEQDSTYFDKAASLEVQIHRGIAQGETLRRTRVAEEIIGSFWFPSVRDPEEAIDDAH
jgi:hypothetical protein